ncbi:MAG: hypothetical protein KJ626_06685 [Verrucomicrobia bacterium]|nr:hypothetical protein [Verrucomicrobiota bacterium]
MMKVCRHQRAVLCTGACVLVLFAISTAHAVRYVWQGSGDPQPPYGTWNKAAHTIQAALLFAPAGETVMVRADTYFISQQINVSNNYVIVSETGDPATTVIHGNGGVRCLNFEASGSTFAGFTVTAGETALDGGGVYAPYGVTITNCIVVSNSVAGSGGGIWNKLGEIRDCRVAQNRASDGAGIYSDGADVYQCVIVDNAATNGAGGVQTSTDITIIDRCVISSNTSISGGPGGVRVNRKTTMWNTLVSHNYAGVRGGGVYAYGSYNDKPKVDNCTIVDNSAGQEAGGIYANNGPWIRNTIVYYNDAPEGPNWGGSQAVWFNHACSTPIPDADGNVQNAPEFMDRDKGNYRLSPGSPCLDAGIPIGTYPIDLDEESRTVNGTIDLGCYEARAGMLAVNVLADQRSGAPIHSVTLNAEVTGTNTTGLFFLWDIDADGTWDLSGSGLSSVDTAYTNSGAYSVEVLVSNAIGESAGILKADYITVGPTTLYVANGGGNVSPYDHWAKAATTIPAAISAAVEGATIVLSDEVFNVSSSIRIDKGVTIRGVGAPEDSVIDGGQATRCVELAHADALLDSLTVRAGQAMEGGGVFIAGGGTISNCVIRDCYANNYGGGIYAYAGGVIQNSLITSNGCSSQGAGAFLNLLPEVSGCTFYTNVSGGDGGGLFVGGQGLTIVDCRLVTNRADYGGGVYIDASATILSNCHVSGNYSESAGAGIHLGDEWCRIENCVVKGNYLEDNYGGGMYIDDDSNVIRGSSIISNYSGAYGGGVYVEAEPNLFEDCLFDGNVSEDYPGGLYNYYGAVNRCIFRNNSCGDYGGGVYMYGGGMTNCLVVGNTADQGGGIYLYDGVVQNCTVVHNISTNEGGGIYDGSGVIRNSIVVFNRGPTDYSNYYDSATWEFSCMQPILVNTGNIDADPQFAARYRIRPPSPCVDAGGTNDAPTRDFYGVVRPLDGDGDGTNRCDMGYTEYEDLPADQDVDGDGLTDLDEIYVYDFNPDDPDMDDDGLNDGDEVAAGTSPIDRNDVFELTDFDEVPTIDGRSVLVWSSVAGKQYAIWRGFDLNVGFTPIAQHIQAFPPINSWTDTVTGAHAWFYAIEVE